MGRNYVNEIVKKIRSAELKNSIHLVLENYHENDIAEALKCLEKKERQFLYAQLTIERLSEIFSYVEDATVYFSEMNVQKAAEIISEMDSDDAVDILERMDDELRKKIVGLLEEDSCRDIRLIRSYSEDEIGSMMTTNYIDIPLGLNVKEAMKELVRQAEENDNIDTLYVHHEDGTFYGAMELKDLIMAREYTDLKTIISDAYPYVKAKDKISDSLEKIRGYAEDSLPVLDDQHRILGVITAQDIIEAVDEEMGDDYAKLGGLTEEEDLNESLIDSMKKRLPWLFVLLLLGIVVSSVVGIFEKVVAQIAIIVCFQSLILDMAGNVGTQSLAVTIRVLSDGGVQTSQKIKLLLKEMKIGFFNGLVLGVLSFLTVGGYIWLMKNYEMHYAFAISGCVGLSLVLAMVISSVVGTITPLFFDKIHIDPAVASGPLITTINDLVAVISYYGLVWLLLLEVLKMGN